MAKHTTTTIQEALTLLDEAAREKKDDIGELVAGKYEALKEAFLGVEADVADKAKQGSERLSELKDAATERVKDAAHLIDKKVHQDPWMTLGLPILGALAIGFLLGRKD